MKKLLCLSVAAGMLSACNGAAPMLAVTPALAPQARAQSDAGVRNAIKTSFQLGFEAKDQNKDGFLSPEESAMSTTDFTKADLDKDKRLSLKEVLYGSKTISKSAFEYIKNLSYQVFSGLDRNRDGFFTLDELQASLASAPSNATSTQTTLFFTADRNRDRKLSLSEYEDVMAWSLVGSITGSQMAPPSGPNSPGQGAVTPPPPPTDPVAPPADPAAPTTP